MPPLSPADGPPGAPPPTGTADLLTRPPHRAEVVTVRPSGEHRHLTLSVPGAPAARPGQFVVVPPRTGTGTVLPGQWWLAGARHEPRSGTTWEVLLREQQAGDHELVWGPLEPGTVLPVRGPQGRGFALPTAGVPTVLVADAGAAGPAGWLARRLADRGCAVTLLLAGDGPRPGVGALGRRAEVVVREAADEVELTAETVRLLGAARAPVAYGAGGRPLVRAVARAAKAQGAHAQVTVYLPGARPGCGTGLCGACEVPAGPPGRAVRGCTVGPVLRGDQVGWQRW